MTNMVDAHVGRKIREARVLRGMSQSDVARGLGMSFQQVQKYETGANRISASRLYELSTLLDVPIQNFFEGVTEDTSEPPNPLDARTARAARDLSRIEASSKRDMILSLIHEILRDQESRVS